MSIPSRNEASLAPPEKLVPVAVAILYNKSNRQFCHCKQATSSVPIDEVLQDLVQGMPDMKVSIGIRRAVMKSEDILKQECQ
jgi:hypothetical protein